MFLSFFVSSSRTCERTRARACMHAVILYVVLDSCPCPPYVAQLPIDIPCGVVMHDFAITENYAVFLDLPVVFKPENFLKGQIPIEFDPTLEAR